ncbi:hypothetical protein AB6A40_002643 [Gnathostoma spinigerum]|uniref:Uncharacterized protein n=1 Tax=Gnathostoma spinigerum TaxID=75299 RepID=A0ABD6EF02_9BILA
MCARGSNLLGLLLKITEITGNKRYKQTTADNAERQLCIRSCFSAMTAAMRLRNSANLAIRYATEDLRAFTAECSRKCSKSDILYRLKETNECVQLNDPLVLHNLPRIIQSSAFYG